MDLPSLGLELVRIIPMAEAALKLSPISDALLYVARADLRPIFRKILKDLGVINIVTPDSVDACMVELLRYDRGLLILDWNNNTGEVVKILAAAQAKYSTDTRAIFLLVAEVNSDLLAISAEYNVSRVHTGPVSMQTLRAHLHSIVGAEDNSTGLRCKLAQVAALQAVNDLTLAEDLLNDLRDEFQDDARVLAEQINNLILQDKWSLARDLASDLRHRYPGDIRGMHLYGRCLLKFGRYDEACEVLKAANFLNPFNADRLVDLGTALLNLDRIKHAEESYNAALALVSDHPEAIKGKSQCRLLEGDVNEALELLRQFSTSRELAAVFNDSAIISIRHSRFAQGVTLYRAAMKAVGARSDILAKLHFNLGIAFFKAGSLDDAFDEFKISYIEDSSFRDAAFNLRICALRLGKMSEYKKIVGDSPDPSAVDRKQRDSKDLIDDFTDAFDDEKLS